MKRTSIITATTLAASSILSAGAPVASATSSAPFQIQGSQVGTEGVPTWPVMAGDEISAGATPVTLNFKDGSRLTLQKDSKAKVEWKNEAIVLNVIAGAVMVAALTKLSHVQVAAQSQPVAVTPGQTVPATPTPVTTTPAPSTTIPKTNVPTASGGVAAEKLPIYAPHPVQPKVLSKR